MKLRKFVLGAVLAGVVALTGCAKGAEDDGIATAGGGAGGTTASPSPLSDEERGRKFAQCMRDNGVDMPDPEPGQRGIRITGGPVDRDKVQAAMQACQEFAPNGGEPPQLDPEQIAAMREMAKCMRENGVENFPDPSEDGRMMIGGGPGSGIDPQDPTFQAAFEKCRQHLPEEFRR